jgi:hypothetical protein
VKDQRGVLKSFEHNHNLRGEIMRFLKSLSNGVAFLVLCFESLLCIPCQGQSAAPPVVSASNPPSVRNGYPACIIPADLDDPAFAQHVNLLLLGTAWDKQDPAMLTDLGLQVGEGERILLRPHKALKSEVILELAAHLAGDRKDRATLTRLARVADKRGDKRLAALVTQQVDVAAKINSHPLADAIEDMSPAALETHKAAIRRIRAARLAGSREGLDALDKYFDQQVYLHKSQQEHIDKEIAKAKENIPKNASFHDLIVILDRLAAITPCSN